MRRGINVIRVRRVLDPAKPGQDPEFVADAAGLSAANQSGKTFRIRRQVDPKELSRMDAHVEVPARRSQASARERSIPKAHVRAL